MTTREVRDALSALLLVVLAGAGMFVLMGALLVALVVGGPDGWGELLRAIAFTVAGFAGAAALPAVVALWLRAAHPTASGVVATAVGALAVCLCGPHAAGSGTAAVVAFGGLLLVGCAVPLPADRAGDTFAG